MIIGVTEAGDGGLDQSWREKLANGAVDGAVIITKAPQKFLYDEYGSTLPDKCVLHCTITGLGGSAIEPNVVSPDEALDAYHTLKYEYGGERVVLRIDPIIPYGKYLDKALDVYYNYYGDGGRLRVSFLDLYPHVKERLCKIDESFRDYPFHAPIEVRKQIYNMMLGEYAYGDNWVEICGEPDMPCTGCVSRRDIIAMGLDVNELMNKKGSQRPACACIAEKTELLTQKKQCKHNCIYCYWGKIK
jgi:DNA repair photolyase